MTSRDPRRRPAVAWYGLVGALLLAGLAVLAGQHFAAERGWTSHESWLRRAMGFLEDPRPSTWIVAGGIAAAILGLLFLVIACLPARRSHRRAEGHPNLWVSRQAIEAMAADAAERAPGVLHGRATLRRRRLHVEALLVPDAPNGVAGIAEAVGDRLSGLTDPEVSVQAKERTR
ncbi:DUF6286 domain-containing protein [Glycomyces sp. TRM65418]|uniref:DUF6286 domain-containing protein n=1 Tax=Glycomyces sp. TRM65418 TaxID=2867006 RepID=UPI001CE6A919|nr:DUF6286 domain-containing protein [Glycomyces sp. TRM65418]MCC3765315.1 DUF6286 domain-containing protein [Glycomyces sp. TRM65418]QZD54933.1 hypothetical protein K3N28_19740 [Glycomyces sp. TRM65418]